MSINKEIREWLNESVAKQNIELATERDIWKCEAERLELGYDALKAENESLRKDAGQWRALVGRAQDPVIGYTGCVICGSADHGGWSCQNYPGGKS